MLLRSYIHKTL